MVVSVSPVGVVTVMALPDSPVPLMVGVLSLVMPSPCTPLSEVASSFAVKTGGMVSVVVSSENGVVNTSGVVVATSASGCIPSAIRAMRTKVMPPSSAPPAFKPAAVSSRPCSGSWPCSSAAIMFLVLSFSGAIAVSLLSTGVWEKISSFMLTVRSSENLTTSPFIPCSSINAPSGITIFSPRTSTSPTCSKRLEPSADTAITLPETAITLPCTAVASAMIKPHTLL